MKPAILFGRRYDRIRAIVDGTVSVGGRQFEFPLMPDIPTTFKRMMEDDHVLAGEMSFGFHVGSMSASLPSRFVGLPVFLSRSFRHGNVFVQRSSALINFSQLKGKRIGLEEYAMTMGIWVRALLQEAGVKPEDIHWVTAREPVAVPEVETSLAKRLKLTRVTNESSWSLLERGEVDAVIGKPPDGCDLSAGPIRRLLSDHWAEQMAYFRRTGIFPPMHLLVLRRDAYEREPQLARDLYNACLKAKRIALADLANTLSTLPISLPMLDLHVNETKRMFGDDWWPYGVKANNVAIETFASQCFSQGIVGSYLDAKRLFCQELLDS